MLQPRLLMCGSEMGLINCVRWGVVVLLFTLATCQEINENEPIEVSRIKREGVPENRDLTVLLVNDQKRNDYAIKSGRYHSVKPLIGLLTSTARTFIQDGVTTEFATQILGTTLDNGRIYAQVLTKSSLVLYSKPYNDDPYVVSPTRVPSLDGWNVKQDLGIIDPEKFVLKNTDYLAPSSKMDIVYASKPAKESFKFWNSAPDNQFNNQIVEEPIGRRVQAYNEIPKFETFNYLDGPAIENEKKVEYVVVPNKLNDVNSQYRQSKAYNPALETPEESKIQDDTIKESEIVKVKPNYDLPTFTIKNEFSPIFYYIDNVESRQSAQQTLPQTKLPKKLFGHKSEPRPKKTFTYQGFADFTTIVGDTVIIFTPNTDPVRQSNPDEVNIFPSAKPVDKLATKITFLSADIPVASSTYNAHEENMVTKLAIPNKNDDSSEKLLFDGEKSEENYSPEINSEIPNSINIHNSNGFDLNLDVIQPSEPVFTTTESTQNTDNLEIISINEQSLRPTEPLNTINPSTTVIEESKESVVTEGNINELFTNSEEETENTAAEDEDEDSEERESTHEMDPELQTTTESGHSEESEEEIETTTENIYNKHEQVFCDDGLETQSTMTTEYKTLTYLTTYFIPLESTETTTSVKSDVVVESNVGYLTNVVCKSDTENIEPTSVINGETIFTQQSHLETPNTPEDYNDVVTNAVTESTPKTTPMQEIFTPSLEDESITQEDINEPEIIKKEDTTSSERVSTTESHVEESVSTEHTPTEKQLIREDINDAENEIDLIYKTLYTTYTYFTTFFGDQTSSIASHKSVVTNIITSTVDLSQLDPSLLGAFDDEVIAPTNVGIGRPTETIPINSIIDLVKNKDVIESVEIGEQYNSQTPTPILEGVLKNINPDSVKTYYTTYTFFTTIYVGTDANICSRNEVYTNYVGPDELRPTKSYSLATESTRAQFDFRNCKQVKANIQEDNSNISQESTETSISVNSLNNKDSKESPPLSTPLEVDMLFSVDSNPLISENSYVTDIKSSSSKGETKYLDNNNVLDDQISSESNIDEIIPSPTLLLQTSYTTFTYFTTMYVGKESSNVKSRLETITNVVTETITPKSEPEEESNLPITYYTTFTYWTTLYKDKSTTITSREEIVSNIVTPSVQVGATVSPIDTSPIDVDSVLPPKDLEVVLKPSLLEDTLEHDDGKATFYTTYTYFTTFYSGNTSQIRSSLATVTNIVDNTKVLEDNQLGRKIQTGGLDKNLVQDNGEKLSQNVFPTPLKEEIKATQLPDLSSTTNTVLQGTYIDNLFAEVKPQENPEPIRDQEKKIIFSQIAVISGDSTIVTNDNKTLDDTSTTTTITSTTTTESVNILTSNPDVIESSVTEPETTTQGQLSEEEDDEFNSRKKGRLSFTAKKPTFTPVIIPFASRNRPTFSPKRQQLPNSATTITRPEFTPTITATPTLKSTRPTGSFGGNRKPIAVGSSSNSGRRFSGRSSTPLNPSANIPASRPGGFGRASIQPSARRTGFRSSSLRNNVDISSRSTVPKIRPSATTRPRSGRQSSSVFYTPSDQNEGETYATQQEENITESLDEVTETPSRQTTNNPLLKFRRPPIARQPGTALIPRSTTPAPRRAVPTRGRLTTTTRRTTTRTTNNPLFSLRRQRPNALFPRRDLFKQPEAEAEEEIREDEQKVDESDEILEEEEFEEDNDYDSSDRKEQKVATPAPLKKSNVVSIRPFGFKRRVRRQVDYGSRKYNNNFRRPGTKSVSTRRPDPEPETEAPAPPKSKPSRYNARVPTNSRSTTASAPKSTQRQPFIVRGESRTTTMSSPAYKRGGKSRPSSRTTTLSSRPKAPRLSGKNSSPSRSNSGRTTSRNSRTRTTTSRASSRQRSSFENLSGERYNKYDNILNDGKITVTHQIPFEVTIPIVNGKITEYKNVLSAKPSIETLLLNQVSTSIGPLGNQQLVLAVESTELAENGATKLTKYILHETPTTTVIFTPTSIRGRKTSFSHVLPSTVYNVEPVIQTIAPEINANVPLANLLLSQLLLGNQQPAINPLLALQGQALLPQQPVVQTPVTEYKTRSTTYVTTVTDARETVLSITFRGTPILTTIVNPTTDVITATELITETVVTTPTVLAPPPQQFNSLLLPLLLQQQQQQQALQTANPLLGLGQNDLSLLSNNLGQNNIAQNNNYNNDIFNNSPKPNVLSDFNSNEDFSEDAQSDEEDIPPPSPPPSRRRSKPKSAKPTPPKLTSVVTLYVSGKHPGEFSTVLSTVVTDDTQTVRKREAIYFEDVKIIPSILPTVNELYGSQGSVENSILSDMDKYFLSSGEDSQVETQSLESIIGSLSSHIKYDASPTYVVKLASASVRDTKQSSLDGVS